MDTKEINYDYFKQLATRLDSLIDKSFDSFKVFVPAFALMIPLTKYFSGTEDSAINPFLLFIIYMLLYLILMIIGYREILFNSIIVHYIEKLKDYEKIIGEDNLLGNSKSIFSFLL